MQLSHWCDPATSGNDLQLAVQMIADLEALWRTSESLTQWYSSGVSVSHQTFTERECRGRAYESILAS